MMGAMRAPAACTARRCAPARPCGRVRRAAARACSGGSDGLTEGQRRFAERKAAMADRVRAAYEAEAAKDAGTHGDAVDVSKLSESQRAFLKRKKFVAEGGDPMAGVPVCKVCNGTGVVECPKCEGTGRNKEDVFEGVRARARARTQSLLVRAHVPACGFQLTLAHPRGAGRPKRGRVGLQR